MRGKCRYRDERKQMSDRRKEKEEHEIMGNEESNYTVRREERE